MTISHLVIRFFILHLLFYTFIIHDAIGASNESDDLACHFQFEKNQEIQLDMALSELSKALRAKIIIVGKLSNKKVVLNLNHRPAFDILRSILTGYSYAVVFNDQEYTYIEMENSNINNNEPYTQTHDESWLSADNTFDATSEEDQDRMASSYIEREIDHLTQEIETLEDRLNGRDPDSNVVLKQLRERLSIYLAKSDFY